MIILFSLHSTAIISGAFFLSLNGNLKSITAVWVWLVLSPPSNLLSWGWTPLAQGLLWQCVLTGIHWTASLELNHPFRSQLQLGERGANEKMTALTHWKKKCIGYSSHSPSLRVVCSENSHSRRICSWETEF